jgi:hypothetical protein
VRLDRFFGTSDELYLDLLKRTLTRVIVARGQERQTISPGRSWLRAGNQLVQRALRPLGLEIVRLIRTSPRDYVESGYEGHPESRLAALKSGGSNNSCGLLAIQVNDGTPMAKRTNAQYSTRINPSCELHHEL